MQTLIEHWLLDIFVTGGTPMTCFIPNIDYQGLNMTRIPGLEEANVYDVLFQLLRSGHLVLKQRDSSDPAISDNMLKSMSSSELLLYLEQCVGFITTKGAAKWEQYAQPEWNRCFDIESDYDVGQIVSPNLTLALALLLCYHQASPGCDYLPDPCSAIVTVHSQYQMFDWKMISSVYVIEFRVRQTSMNVNDSDNMLNQWRESLSWFKRPWETTLWPKIR